MLTLDEAFKALKESNEDLAEYGSFAEYAEERLPHEARYKEYYMEPEEAGKMYVNSGREGKCDLLWVCQEDCSSEDFDTLMKAFGEYYPEETDGKTYTAIMKSRSYPGYGNFIKKVVTFHNGDPVYEAAEKEVLFYGRIELNLGYNNAGFMFYISCPGEDMEGQYAKTIGEAKDFFEDELERGEEYVSFDPGYESAGYDIELDTDLPDSHTAEDYVKKIIKGSPKNVEKLYTLIDNGDLDPIAEGEYTMYQQLKESLNEANKNKNIENDLVKKFKSAVDNLVELASDLHNQAVASGIEERDYLEDAIQEDGYITVYDALSSIEL